MRWYLCFFLVYLYKIFSVDNERNFEKLLLTNLVIYFQFLLLKWRIYLLPKPHKSSSSTAFIKKALYKNVTPTFANIKGQFSNGNVKLNAEKGLMKSHLNNYFNDIRDLKLEYNTVKDKLEGEISPIFAEIML